MLPLRCCYDPTTTMKIWLRLVYADGDVAGTLLRPWRCSYAFVAILYPFYIESEIPIRFDYDQDASTALLLHFYCALAVSATIRVILTKISNHSGIAVQWNGGFRKYNFVTSLYAKHYVKHNIKYHRQGQVHTKCIFFSIISFSMI